MKNMKIGCMSMKTNSKTFMILELYRYIKENYKIFDDLCKRLQDDYNCVEIYNKYKELANSYCLRNNKR